MFKHSRKTNLANGELSNLDFILLYLLYNGPSRRVDILQALYAWRGMKITKHSRNLTEYFQRNASYDFLGQNHKAGPYRTPGTPYIFTPGDKRYHLAHEGLHRLAWMFPRPKTLLNVPK